MAEDKIKLEITVNKSDIRNLILHQHKISCKGATHTSEPIDAIVQLEIPPRSHVKGESYVLCPRLRQISNEIGCYERSITMVNTVRGEITKEDLYPCPYFRPA